MSPPVSQIGSFRFVSLEGNVEAIRSQLEVLTRPGVPGVGIWDTGKRGAPFRLVSGVDCETWAATRSYYKQYRALIDAAPVEIIWCDLDVSTLDEIVFQVLDVQLGEPPHKLFTTVGGINPPSVAWLSCVWDIIPIAKVS